MLNRIAIAGASGLVGSELLKLCLAEPGIEEVRLLVRKKLEFQHPQLQQHIVDYEKPETLISALETVETLFCCLGTTVKKAGSKENFYRVDHDYVRRLGSLAVQMNVKDFLFVSSIGADLESPFFYLKTKAEAEQSLMAIPFPSLKIFRPSVLQGSRNEFRFGEVVGVSLLQALRPVLRARLRRLRPTKASELATAMLRVAQHNEVGKKIFESDEIPALC